MGGPCAGLATSLTRTRWKLAVRGGSTVRLARGPRRSGERGVAGCSGDKYANSSEIYLLRRGPAFRIASHSFRSRSVHGFGRQSPARALELTEWELAFAGT